MKIPNADIIQKIIRIQDGKADVNIGVYCPFCRVGYALLMFSRTGKYECLACGKRGKLTDLIVYFEDLFEHKHRKTMRLMAERKGVDL